MEKAATASNPVSVFTAEGNLLVIPVSALFFDDNGDIHARPPYSGPDVERWIRYLASPSIQAIRQAPEAPPKPAMVLRAAVPGSTGNNINVKITYPDSNRTEYRVEVTKTDRYTLLKPDTMSKVLAARPGLVHVKNGSATPKMPAALDDAPLKNDGTLEVRGKNGRTAFVLEAKGPASDVQLIKITIDDVDETFTLVAKWTKTATVSGDPKTALADLGYVVVFKPPEGGEFGQPPAGEFNLSGGIDSAAASTTLTSKASV